MSDRKVKILTGPHAGRVFPIRTVCADGGIFVSVPSRKCGTVDQYFSDGQYVDVDEVERDDEPDYGAVGVMEQYRS